MHKTPSVFLRDFESPGNPITDQINPACQWVIDGEGIPTRKYDGTCVMFDGSSWWARREVKAEKPEPPNWIQADGDDVTGKRMGWEPIEQSGWAKFHAEAVAAKRVWDQGTYELCGPKIQANPEGFASHCLVRHESAERFSPMSPDALVDHCREMGYEGIVWHHPDGRMAKLKVRDYDA